MSETREKGGSVKIYAEVTVQDTAAAETALCEAHNTPELIAKFPISFTDGTGDRLDCSLNSALSCQECGVTA